MKTVLLSSRENLVWTSMQEIIPFIERSWLEGTAPAVCLNVDSTPLPEILRAVIQADQVVFTCFTVKLAKVGALLRREFKIDARYIIYLHQLASLGAWPLHEWQLGAVLRRSDVFISTCSRDAEACRRCFADPEIRIIPFGFAEVPRNGLLPGSPDGPAELVFSGRVSPQKNLHTLIYSLALLKARQPSRALRLSIYGKEDHYGSPNMGIVNRSYLEFLRQLCDQLGLVEEVRFHGHLDREELHERLKRSHVFVSPSLHSDENFGMSALRSLCMGAPAVLSDWGGHTDFSSHFPGQVSLLPVYRSPAGPFLDPVQLAEKIRGAVESRTASAPETPPPSCYRLEQIHSEVTGLGPSRSGDEPLQPSRLGGEILSRIRISRKDDPASCRIFSSYSDPLAHVLFEAYGMTCKRAEPSGGVILLPWAVKTETGLRARDPHRGEFEIPGSLDDQDRIAFEYGLAHAE